ncbi:conserved hypothetical protein [Aeropyrum pernix K1]|uniref:Thioredoxin domain-containing protein n=1 Tax=Aeropyrum pernix (strain ATCC 700893 / DSM 11879 / JCM 9820 / NBRC 100138 / K1) TaxID=272557 RepID=Q9Y8R5_AERPE|nr:TlpA disulfide reductase family protein [Aeropyrum pernix]BAA81585.2 conserved hypothetical protein [Aeropyrum pernix K1]
MGARQAVIVTAAIVLLLVAGYTAYTIAIPRAAGHSEEVLEREASFSLTTIDGEVISLNNVGGDVVILWFMAAWCPSCVYMADLLDRLTEKYREISVIAIDFWTAEALKALGLNKPGYPPPDTPEMFRKFIANYGDPSWIMVMDDGSLVEKFNVRSIDYIVIMDKSSNVLYAGTTPSLGELESVIKSVQGG